MQTTDIQAIVRLVKLGASRLELTSIASDQAANPVSLDLEAVEWPPAKVDIDVDSEDKPKLRLRDFLLLDPEAFLTKAYNEILGRPADEGGFKHYLQRLHQGELKQKLLWVFMNSEEGKARGIKIAGINYFWTLSSLVHEHDFTGGRLPRYFDRTLNQLQQRICLSPEDIRFLRFQIYLARFNRASQANARNSNTLIERLDRRLIELDTESRGLKNALSNAYQQIRQLEYQLDQFKATPVSVDKQSVSMPSVDQAHEPAYLRQSEIDRFYFAFEEACRGPQPEILAKLSLYIPQLPTQGSKQVVDVGCGRGEWLEVLAKNGFMSTGLDINDVMIQICLEKGLVAEKRDVIDYLSSQQEGSLAAVTGFHVAEHIPLDLLLRLVKESYRTLEKGGVLILETPNPENLLVGAHTFYHDPTHRNPLTPTLMTFMAQYFGFERVEILRLNPYPEQAKVPGIDPLTERVNGHLCGPQDFALIARK